MRDKDKVADLHSRAVKVREIAKGIFDRNERRFILRFVADSVKITAANRAEHSRHAV
jgi:hypothetical protein